jgi:hypothetical protein
MNNSDKANELLKQVLSATQHGLPYVQASNLQEAFRGNGK